MAQVKIVKINTIVYNPICRYYAWTSKSFKTFTDDNGNKTYYIDSREVSKEDGNSAYRKLKAENKRYQSTEDCKDYIKRQWTSFYKLKKTGRWTEDKFTLHECDTFKQEVEEYEISYEEIIEKLENSIDHHTQYIDNYEQQKQVEENNERIRAEIEKYRELITERK